MKIDSEKEKIVLGGMESARASLADVLVQRRIYDAATLARDSNYVEGRQSSLKRYIKKKYRQFSLCSWLLSILPILKWLPDYQWKRNLIGDIISGFTVSVMHIPQGMGYAMLGNVWPIVGIYMAFFPVLVYVFFGSSRHVSIGTFAVVCLMTGGVVDEQSTADVMYNGTLVRRADVPPDLPLITNFEVAVTVTFTVAIIQIAMYCLRLGVVSTLLSETLVSGFTCGAAFIVVSSQLKDLFGVPVEKRRGYFSFILRVYDAVTALPKANLTSITISVISMSIIVFNEKIIKPRLAKKCVVPVPIELILLVCGTLASYLMDLNGVYSVSIIGKIPTGLPQQIMPKFSLIPSIFIQSFVIAIVSYSITVSMGILFARKLHYEIDFNQELLAMGLSNMLGSFFSSMPISASLSRSLIQESVGGVTQLASVFSCSILICVLLFIGPLFENLPRSVLASIIVVALWKMVMTVQMIAKYWRLSRWDALVWLVTFFCTILLDVSIGLAAGIVMAIYSLFMQGYNPHSCLLGALPNTDIYLDMKRHKGAEEIDKVKIFHYSGSLNFVTSNVFQKRLGKKIGFDPTEIQQKRTRLENKGLAYEAEPLNVKYVILDFSAITFVDPAGVKTLRNLKKDFESCEVEMYIAACSDPVLEIFKRCEKVQDVSIHFKVFPTIHDAVLYARHKSDKVSRANLGTINM